MVWSQRLSSCGTLHAELLRARLRRVDLVLRALVVRTFGVTAFVLSAFVMLITAVGCHPATSALKINWPMPPPDPTTRLHSPFDCEARRALYGRQMPDIGFPPVAGAPPVRDVNGVSFYADTDKSIVDPELKAENLTALRPLRDYVRGVVRLADDWMASKPPRPKYAAYALDALSRWADADALLGSVNPQGEFEREWTLGSLALAYLKIRDADVLDPRKRGVVEAWLRRIAAAVMPYYERPGLKSNANNHAYWSGMAVAAAGIAASDRSLFDWGLIRARIGIGQVHPDGVLPLERDRRALALHYHVFALAPLVMLAEMANANGIRLYDEGNQAIPRLANRVIEGLADPISFSILAGTTQEISSPPAGSDLAWAEAYAARFPDPRLVRWIRAARPLFDVRLGGDMTTAFGAPGL